MMNKTEVITLDDAFRIVDETLADVRLPCETINVREAAGRVLAEDQVSHLDLPPFDKSAMDGYAVLDGDERDEYRLLETVAAGQVGTARLEPGTIVKVMTGSPVPPGSGKVIMIEQTEERDGVVKVHKHDTKQNICWKAEDVTRGQTILAAGTTLDPLAIANLISCGITEVSVARRVRIAIISTGDEIVDSPDLLTPGKIMNSNGPLLAGLSDEFGLEVVSEESVPDDMDATVDALRRALEAADVVVFSGGVSVGEFDFVVEAMPEAGLTVHFSRVAVKPGKPLTYATSPGKVAFGLPGNPVSVYLGFHTFILLTAARMTGGRTPIREFALPLAKDYAGKKGKRSQYVPCRLTDEGAVEQIEFHGSAHLSALSRADGFFLVRENGGKIPAGEKVNFLTVKGGLV